MTPSRAFTDPITLVGAFLVINGTSTPLPPPAKLVSREVAVEQGKATVCGAASLGSGRGWDCALSSEGFTAGSADAVGIETYLVAGSASESGKPEYESYSWSQTLQIREL